MTASTVAYTDLRDSGAAGAFLGTSLSEAFEGAPPHAVVVFASSRYDYAELLEALQNACKPEVLIGCSSAGEFINGQQGAFSVSAVGLRSDEIRFAAGLGQRLRADLAGAASEMVASFEGIGRARARYHTALVLTDALAGRTDDLIQQLTVKTGGDYRFFGGGAGDDARFERTHVFYGTKAFPDAAVALEMLSQKPIGVGVQHGWEPASAPFRVTEASGARLVSLNASPAVEIFEEHAAAMGQPLDRAQPLSFFLHNVLGIDTGHGYQLRVPLSIAADGAVLCAADVPEGATVQIMRTTVRSASEAAATATQAALDALKGHTPSVALFFDCVATRLRLGHEFGLEIDTLERTLGQALYAGCNTYGQIARAEGQFSGFHNCTAVVCVIPQ